MNDALVSSGADDSERVVEGALRPTSLDDFIGQGRVKDQLRLVLSAAKQRDHVADHVLLSGPPGSG